MLAVVFIIHDRARSSVNDIGQIFLCHSFGFARPLDGKANLCKIQTSFITFGFRNIT